MIILKILKLINVTLVHYFIFIFIIFKYQVDDVLLHDEHSMDDDNNYDGNCGVVLWCELIFFFFSFVIINQIM